MALNSLMLSSALKTAFDTKLTEKIGSDYTDLNSGFKTKFLAAIAEATAEQIILHFKQNAEVRVVVVGLDSGAGLSPQVLTLLASRGDAPPFVPDAGLQTEISPTGPVPTTPATVSSVLSVPAIIE